MFLSAQFTQLCQDEQIIVERTVPYAHWQLARIERQWRTLGEGAKTLLVATDLPDKLWGYAFMTMVYIRNRTWSAGANGIPWQLITNKLPDLSNLRTFGCLAYAHIDQSRRNKFDDKSFKGIFIGYAFDSPAWLIYNLTTQRVTRTRSVVFDEEWRATPPILSTTSPSTTFVDDYISDDEDTPIPGEQEPGVEPPAEPEPATHAPGEHHPAPDQLPSTDKTKRRAAQLLKDLASAKHIMEKKPRDRADNRRAEAARLAQETTSASNPPAATIAIIEPTSYKRAMA